MVKITNKIIYILTALFFITLNGYAEKKESSQEANFNYPHKPNYMSGTRTDMGEEQMGQIQNKIGSEEYKKKLRERNDYLTQYRGEFEDAAKTYENTKSRAGVLFIPSAIDKSERTDNILDKAPKVPANSKEAYKQWQEEMISKKKGPNDKTSSVWGKSE